jgi:hypothetical protein
MMKGKCHCSVPFCGRYVRVEEDGGRWLCPKHWRALPLKRRKAYLRAVNERQPDDLKHWTKKPRWMTPREDRTTRGSRSRSIRALWRLYDRLEKDAIALAMHRMM